MDKLFALKLMFGAILLCCTEMIIYNISSTEDLINIAQKLSTADSAIEAIETNKAIKDTSICDGSRFLVFRCEENICGGLGDRQKGIVSTFVLALISNRTFVVDVQRPCDLLNYLEPNIYNWAHCKNYVNTIPSEEMQVFMIGKSDSKINEFKDMNFNETWNKKVVVLEISSYNKVMKSIRLHPNTKRQLGWIQNLNDYEVIGIVLRRLFKPVSKLNDHLNNYVKESSNGRQLVCAHLRIGRNPSNPGDSFLDSPGNFTALLSFVNKSNHVDVKKYVIYLATDSDQVRKDAARILPNYINLNRKIVHIDNFKHLNSTVACEGFYTVLFEQYLLTKCDYLLIGRSNFAAMAAYIRGHSNGLYLYKGKRYKVATLREIQTVYKFQ